MGDETAGLSQVVKEPVQGTALEWYFFGLKYLGISERFAESSEDLFIDMSFWRLVEVIPTWDEYVIHLSVQFWGDTSE